MLVAAVALLAAFSTAAAAGGDRAGDETAPGQTFGNGVAGLHICESPACVTAGSWRRTTATTQLPTRMSVEKGVRCVDRLPAAHTHTPPLPPVVGIG